MNKSVRQKIEADARGHWVRAELGEEFSFSDFTEAAKPWAEWCERFHQVCGPMATLMEDGNLPDIDSQGVSMMIEVFKEYRQWLEEK